MIFKEVEINATHARLKALEYGNPHGPKIFAVHGWLDNAASFTKLAALLPEYHWIMLDLAGHGHSDHRPPGLFQLVDFVYDIAESIRILGWEKVIFLGHSLGGALGTLYVGSFPQLIDKLILIDILGPLTKDPDEAAEQLQKAITGLQNIDKKSLPVYPNIEEAAKARVSHSQIEFESALALAERGTKPVSGGVTWRTDPRLTLASPFMLTDEQAASFLSAIACPTLLIQPSHGFPFSPEKQAFQKSLLNALQIASVPGCHHVHLDAPTEVAKAIAEFLKK